MNAKYQGISQSLIEKCKKRNYRLIRRDTVTGRIVVLDENNISRGSFGICERCLDEAKVITCSYFNEEMICVECSEVESRHPDYEKAKAAEQAEVDKGNFNFKGIGLPKELL